jgi:hypothetical protein
MSVPGEVFPAGYVREEQAQMPAQDTRLDEIVSALNALHGFLSDEFSSL